MKYLRISLRSFLIVCAGLAVAVAIFFRTPVPKTLTVEIVEDVITVEDRPLSHFHVLFTNHSRQHVRLWDEWIMWGHTNLSFELLDTNNKSLGHLSRTNQWFGRNFPRFTELKPGEHFIMDVYFDSKEWSIPVLPGKDYDCFLVANYDVNRSIESDQHEVWVGAIESPPKRIKLRYWPNPSPVDESPLPTPETTEKDGG